MLLESSGKCPNMLLNNVQRTEVPPHLHRSKELFSPNVNNAEVKKSCPRALHLTVIMPATVYCDVSRTVILHFEPPEADTFSFYF